MFYITEFWYPNVPNYFSSFTNLLPNGWNASVMGTHRRWCGCRINVFIMSYYKDILLMKAFRLTVRLRPWHIKLHLGRSWSQLEGPKDPWEKNKILGDLRFSVKGHLLAVQTAMCLVSLESSFGTVREWCLFRGAILNTLCVIQV